MEAALQISLIVTFLLLGRVWPRDSKAPLVGRDTLVNVVTGGILFVFRVSIVAWVARVSDVHLIDLGALSHPAAQLAFAFVVTDLARYWVHFAHHRVPVLWTFHRVHHSSRALDSTSGLRMHLADFIQLSAIPIVLFGIVFDARGFAPEVWWTLGGIVAFFDAFQHANLRMDLRSPVLAAWERVFNNPHFHSWHHTRDVARYGDGNYGQTLTVWDRLFGTLVAPEAACTELGLPDDQDLETSPLGLQLLRPNTHP